MGEPVGQREAGWRDGLRDVDDSLFDGREQQPVESEYASLTYEVTDRIARITFNRPHRGNTITADTPRELVEVVERADLDPEVHVILLSGRGKGFCGGYDLGIYAEADGSETAPRGPSTTGTVIDPIVQARNHNPHGQWDPMVDYAMMSRFTRAFSCLMHADKPTVAKIHGFCVAGGTDIALHCDQIIAADDTKIGYPPTRVWGVPSAGLWAHRLGDQRAKRLLFTGDCITGEQAAEWGLAVESAPADQLDDRTEELVARIARMPTNQLMMVKLALNSALDTQGVSTSAMISTVFDGVSRHTREGYAFQQRAATVGFREAVRERDEVFGDHKRNAMKDRSAGPTD
ncbi:crotonase/enoyl-CoA hydratase family protein [Williamsia sterculiae]